MLRIKVLSVPRAVATGVFSVCKWWRWQESNLRPPECKSGALPAELHPPCRFLDFRLEILDFKSAFRNHQSAIKMVAGTGFEPATFGLWAQRATGLLHPAINYQEWWAWVDSNYRPHAYQACALTNWATGPQVVSKSPKSINAKL